MRWLTAGWSAARDEVRFRLFDLQARRAAKATSVVDFPTHDLERELGQARELLAAELERRYDAPMRANRDRLAAARSIHAGLASESAVLDRDQKAELDDAYAQAAALRSEMDAVVGRLDEARRELAAAKSRASSWHARSKSRLPFYGKRGKPIPRHSFFFSHSDLDAAKRDADRAAMRIGDAKRDRDHVAMKKRRVGEKIEEIKASRARRKAMLEVGRSRSSIQAEKRSMLSEIIRLDGAEGRMAGLREAFDRDGPQAVEVAKLLARIRDQLAGRVAAMKAFDAPESRDERRTAFRATVNDFP